jgi:hypothetical protein
MTQRYLSDELRTPMKKQILKSEIYDSEQI